jgi:formamidopyrimidine-DNA glycosylase
LFMSKLKPSRKVAALRKAEVAKLHQSIRYVLTRAVKARGTSFNSYVDGLGRAGTYWAKRLVYGRAGLPCKSCGVLLKKTVVAGRGTTWCASCQR